MTDISPALRERLIALGWTPPGEARLAMPRHETAAPVEGKSLQRVAIGKVTAT